MEIKQAIQASANVVRITAISAGDVYKRFDKNYTDRIYYGIVQSVHNDGESAIIQAIEYRYEYGSLDISVKILNSSDDYLIFPATPEDLQMELDSARSKKLRDIQDSEDRIYKDKKIVAEIDKLMSGETQKNLKAMSYKELTTESYNQTKALIS